MPDPQTWLLDFDETLASGNITYALQYAFPKFIRDHNLKPDPERLKRITLELQERATTGGIDPAPLLTSTFGARTFTHRHHSESFFFCVLWKRKASEDQS